MTTWDKLCRICSSPAHYSVFEKIPIYIHEAPEFAINWQRPISDMLHDTTGLKVIQNDGLPSCICAVCISYLKHAVTFHDRAINNARSLRSVLLLAGTTINNTNGQKCQDKKFNEIKIDYDKTMKNIAKHYKLLNFNSNGICKVNKELFSKHWHEEIINPPTEQEITFNLRELALLFYERKEDKRMAAYKRKFECRQFDSNGINSENDDIYVDDDNNNDEDIISATAGECLFSYKEKHFQEDDVMEQEDLLKSVGIKEPENCYERKCRACNYRSLLEKSFSSHLELCVEYRFLLLVEELNLLLNIRRRKAISPHEYMRRFIFCLRKTCDWLANNCNESLPLPTGRKPNVAPNETHHRSEGDGGCQIAETTNTINITTNQTLNNGECIQVQEEEEDDDELQTTTITTNKKIRRGGKRHNNNSNKLRTKSNNDEITVISPMASNDDKHVYKMCEMQNKLREVFSKSKLLNNEITTNLNDNIEDNKIYDFENIWQKAIETMPMRKSEMQTIQSPPPKDKEQTFLLRPKARYSIKSPPASSLPVPFKIVTLEQNQHLQQQQQQQQLNGYAAHCSTCNMCFDTLHHFEIHNAVIHNNK